MVALQRKRVFSAVLVVVLFSLCMGRDSMLQKGTVAPDFTLDAQDGTKVSLGDFKGKKYVVLIFYPGDETPVCTAQLCEIRDEYASFEKRGAVVFGVNPASKKSHQKFVQKNSFQFPLLIDEDKKAAKAYHAKGFLMNKRTVYVIDPQGKIVYAQRGKPPVSDILASIPETAASDSTENLDLNLNK